MELENNDSTLIAASSSKPTFNTYQENPYSITVHILFIILGLTLNSLTILVVVKGSTFGQKIKIQLLNLAVADMISSLFILGATPVIEFATLSYPNSAELCKIHIYIGFVITYDSVLCHMLIAIERFVAVFFPFSMVHYRKRHAITVYVSLFLLSCVINITAFFDADIENNPNGSDSYFCFNNMKSSTSTMLTTALIKTKYLLPTVVVLGAYISIGVRLKFGADDDIKLRPEAMSERNRIIIMLAVDGVFSMMIWFPYAIYDFVKRADGHPNTLMEDLVKAILYGLIHTNCFASPVVYLMFNKNFKKELKQLLCSRCRKQPKDSAAAGDMEDLSANKVATASTSAATDSQESPS